MPTILWAHKWRQKRWRAFWHRNTNQTEAIWLMRIPWEMLLAYPSEYRIVYMTYSKNRPVLLLRMWLILISTSSLRLLEGRWRKLRGICRFRSRRNPVLKWKRPVQVPNREFRTIWEKNQKIHQQVRNLTKPKTWKQPLAVSTAQCWSTSGWNQTTQAPKWRSWPTLINHKTQSIPMKYVIRRSLRHRGRRCRLILNNFSNWSTRKRSLHHTKKFDRHWSARNLWKIIN